jgi:hypothetical protein
MFLNTKFHTSRIPNRASAAEAAPARTFSRAVHTNSASLYALRAPNDGERTLLTAIAGGDVSALTSLMARGQTTSRVRMPYYIRHPQFDEGKYAQSEAIVQQLTDSSGRCRCKS